MVNKNLLPNSSPLAELQKKFAIIDLSGEIRVVDLQQISDLLSGSSNTEPAMYKKSDAELMMKRFLEALPMTSKPAQVVADFWVSPLTRMYNKTAFTPKPTPEPTLNYWVDPTPIPKAGNWVLLRDYLRDTICSGNHECFDYLIRYMAHMIQKPEEKPGVMVVLLGGQGTGKGIYFSLLRAIWPRTTLQVADVDQVIGKFTACLERNYIICMDEALFAGDRKSMDRLKSTVTESVIQIEQKYQPSRTIDSVHRFFAASNHDHFAHVERDDRRFVILRVADSRQQNTSYFGSIVAAISDPLTIGALFYYLQRKDIKDFDVRAKPKTGEHLSQKLKSLQGFDRYWYEVLFTGNLNGVDRVNGWEVMGVDTWVDPIFVPTSTLVSNYKDFNKNAQRHQTVQAAEVPSVMRRMCPSAKSDRQVCKKPGLASNSQQRGFQLPDLATARHEFGVAIGGEVPWD